MPENSTVQPQVATPKESHPDKVLGYILLAIGIIIIVATTVYALLVLTGKSKAPQVLKVAAPTFSLSPQAQMLNLDSLENSGVPPQLLEQLNQTNQEPQQSSIKLLKDEDFSNLLNIGIFYFLVMFLASVGAKISSIGIQLIKDINVKVKQ